MPVATVNAAAAENTGRQRALSQSNSGKRKTEGVISDQGPVSRANVSTLATATATIARVPSRNSRHNGGSRTAAATPMRSGATVMMPSASDANQTSQTSKNPAVAGPTSFMAPAAPMADAAVAILAAAKKPATRHRLSRLKWGPNQRSISHLTNRASPALHRPKAKALQTFLSVKRAAAALAPITATATGTRAEGPRAIRTPTEMPAAGQNTATRSV